MTRASLGLLVSLFALAAPSPAAAAPEDDIKGLYEKGVEAYDNDLDFDAARASLEKALVIIARNPGKVPGTLVAKVQIRLGVLYIAVDKDRAKGLKAFINALKADPTAKVDASLSNPDISEVYKDAKETVGTPGTPIAPSAPVLLGHRPPREASSGTPLRIRVEVPEGLKASKVVARYRSGGQLKFSELPLDNLSANTYQSNLGSEKIRGGTLEYYVSAEDDGGKIVGLSGSADAPHLVKITSTEVDPEGATRETDPDPPKDEGPKPNEPAVMRHSFSFLIRGGGGAGTVTGVTDQGATLGAGVSVPEIIVSPEVAIYLSPRTTIGAVGRVQLTSTQATDAQGNAIGDKPKTPTAAGALRLRYFNGKDQGFRPYFSAEAGFGQVAQGFKAFNGQQSLGTQTDVDKGPLLGVGWGFENDLSGLFALNIDTTVRGYFDLADGLPVAQIDLTLGIRLGN
jgi:hypothetical protein